MTTEATVVPGADALRRSPLHDRHVALGAKFAAFGGWEMPLEYAGGGVLSEHAAVRTAVGVFDVSHLGKARVTGPGAADFVNACLTNDLGRIAPGQAQYTLCCDDATGGVVDDLIAYLYGDDDVFLIPNAANTAEVVRRLRRGRTRRGHRHRRARRATPSSPCRARASADTARRRSACRPSTTTCPSTRRCSTAST